MAVVLLRIIDTNATNLFGENLLAGLRAIHRVIALIDLQLAGNSPAMSLDTIGDLIALCTRRFRRRLPRRTPSLRRKRRKTLHSQRNRS